MKFVAFPANFQYQCISDFSHGCDYTLDKLHLKERRAYFGSKIGEAFHHGGGSRSMKNVGALWPGGMAQPLKAKLTTKNIRMWVHCVPGQQQREMKAGPQLAPPLCPSVCTQVP